MSLGFPGVQISIQPLGKNVTFRGKDAEELLDLVNGFTKYVNDIVEGVTTIEQVLLAKGVLTGSQPLELASQNSAAPAFQPSSPPPSEALPICEHGTWKDMAGKLSKRGEPYKFRYYCPKFGSECKPQGEWVG